MRYCTRARVYCGTRSPNDYQPVLVTDIVDGSLDPLPLDPSLKLRQHSPTGFAWGYLGSGPAQLALAILLDATGDEELAQRHYMSFKEDFVARWPEKWLITTSDIDAWMEFEEEVASWPIAARQSVA